MNITLYDLDDLDFGTCLPVWRRSQRSADRHLPESDAQRTTRDTDALRPIGNDHPFAIQLERFIRAFVSRLSFGRRPSTVLLAVLAVVVDSVNRMASRPRAHVCDKIRQAISPPLTNSDTPTAVVGESRVLRVVAASDHRVPHRVRSRSTETVRGVGFDQQVGVKTATTPSVATSKSVGTHDQIFAALADTPPSSVSGFPFIWCTFDDRQSAEGFARQVNQRRHELRRLPRAN